MGFENPPDFVVSSDEKRKSSKPLMEKRRRARINQSLNELKNLILEALKKDTSCYSKLEKADILEMTVKYLRSLKTSQTTAAPPMQDYDALSKYRAGFNECANEVSRYLMSLNGLDAQMRAKMLSHLADHCSPAKPRELQETVHRTQILPQPPKPAISLVSPNTGSLLSPTIFKAHHEPLPGAINGSTQFQLVPGQLADGKIAAVLIPSQNPPLPVLPTSPQIFPLFKPGPSDVRASLQAFQFPAHTLRSDSDPLWRPW